MMTTLNDLPVDLPIPEDDGACEHLVGMSLPDLSFESTLGDIYSLSQSVGCTVIYLYPMTGRPDIALPDGWDQIPGARGCTPQSCSFRDSFSELQALGVSIFGMSTQSTDYQQEAAVRLHLPFALLSDEKLKFVDQMSLPTLSVDGMTLSKRITLICLDGVIKKVFYPVFPPDKNADDVIDWVRQNTSELADY